MKSSYLSLVLLAGTAASLVSAQPVHVPLASPRATVSQVIGLTEVTVTYHRPAVGGREVWGKLVPYGFNNLGFGTAQEAPWRAGANENTVVGFQHDVRIVGQPLAAGTYGLHLALTPEGRVTVIFSKRTGDWGSFFYDPAADALRVEVAWEDAPMQEQLSYEFDDVKKDGAVLALRWEKKRIPIPLAVDTDRIVVASLERELNSAAGFQYQAWVTAANYLLTNKLDAARALRWAETAVSGQFVGERNFNSLSVKSAALERLGRADEAKAAMDEALRFASVGQSHQSGRQMLAQKQPARALEVFKLNAELHPGQWPVNYGLARGYSAMGDYAAALAALLQAEKDVPAGDTVNAAAIKTNLEKLSRGEDIN